MLDEYNKVANVLKLPEMNSASISKNSTCFDKPDGLLEVLRGWLGYSGWVCFQDDIVILPIETLPDNLGYPLSAEAVAGSTSFRLLPDGHGGWTISIIEESESGEHKVLWDNVKQLGNGHAPGSLHYRRYWKKDADIGYAPFVARFIGFGEVRS